MSTPADPTNPSGHRLTPAGGPRLRTDVVDVYIYQRSSRPPAGLVHAAPPARSSMDSDSAGASSPARERVYFLQLLRAGPPLANTWHPVMGHVESGETAVACALRELREEVGLTRPLALHALEQVHPFFIAELDSIVLSPRFAAEVAPGWEPALDAEHTAFRWVAAGDAPSMFVWPGQLAACREVLDWVLPAGSLMRDIIRVL
ncbi:MAG: NUDIX domain-containing protein [Phycisphaerales bacterium]